MPHSTHCKWGHAKTRKGQCVECHRARSRAYEANKRAQRQLPAPLPVAPLVERIARRHQILTDARAEQAIRLYHAEKAKRIEAGKPVLKPYQSAHFDVA